MRTFRLLKPVLTSAFMNMRWCAVEFGVFFEFGLTYPIKKGVKKKSPK